MALNIPHATCTIPTASAATHNISNIQQLTSAYLNLSVNLDRAVKAYLDHTQAVLNGDQSLNVGHLLQPFNLLSQQAQMAQLALAQGGGIPGLLPNGGGVPAEIKSEEPEGKKKRKKRAYKQRDPNAPKRPLTAYFRYLGQLRPEIQQEIANNPEQHKTSGKPGDISRIATDRWNQLTTEQQEPYKEAYKEELKDYEVAIAKYKAAGGNPEDLTQVDVTDTTGLEATPAAIEEAPAAEEEKDDDSSSDSDSSSEEEEEEEVAPPPPPPPQVSPKKSALKKTKAAPAANTPAFSSINETAAAAAPSSPPAKSSSPSKKRKGAGEEEGGRKKRGRQSKADEEIIASAEVAPVANMMTSSPEVASTPAVEAGKKKKDKKKRKSGDA